ncbi:MFS transporter [Humibacter ginsenosidimutans]|uniref:MFS transporter n=2 Tax=Humibacter ginsenosidimutans TaxID=2599293 RepID=A0A5B8M9F0_9MICO|nr:MFS transporter [Humibacter ginsenosidimutans]
MSARAWLVLFVLCAAQFMVALDFSILNIALPTLGPDLGLDDANLQWAVTAFALPSGGFLLLAGRIGDLIGRRRMFIAGLVLFTAASVLATFAWGAGPFLAARALQGLGAAAIVPTGMALLTTSFKEGPLRDRAIGISGMILSLGFTVGVVLGGVLTQAFGWRSTMALGVVMGALVLVLAPLLLTESRSQERAQLDVPGAVTVSGGLLALIYGMSEAAQRGWAHIDVIIAVAAALVLLVAFWNVEKRAQHPLVALAVLKRPTVAFGNLGGMVTFAMMSAVMFLSTLYLQQVLGLQPAESGLVFGVMGVVAAVTGVIAPRFIARFGARLVLVVALSLQAVAISLLVFLGPGNGVVLVAVAGSVACIGHLGAVVSYGVAATSGLDNDEQGLATGLVTTAQQVGVTIGIPIISAVAAAVTATLTVRGAGTVDAALGGIRTGLLVDAVVVAAAAVAIGFGLLRRRAAVDAPR